MNRKRNSLEKVNEVILDVEGAVALLGVSKHTIYRLISKDRLPSTKIGKEWRFHRPTLVQWVANSSSVNQLERIFKNVNIRNK